MEIESRAAAKWQLQNLAAAYIHNINQDAQSDACTSKPSSSDQQTKTHGSSCPVCRGHHMYLGRNRQINESSWLADCKTRYGTH